MKRLKLLLKDKRGLNSFVSAATMIPIIAVLAVFIVQYTAIGVSKLAVTEAAFEAARAAARSSTPYQTAVETVKNFGKGLISGWENNVNVSMPQVANNAGDPLTVQVEFPVPKFFTIFNVPVVKDSSTQILEETP